VEKIVNQLKRRLIRALNGNSARISSIWCCCCRRGHLVGCLGLGKGRVLGGCGRCGRKFDPTNGKRCGGVKIMLVAGVINGLMQFKAGW
jgi:hypothetical protein